MLSTGSTSSIGVSLSPASGSRLGSPTRDHVPEESSLLTAYLHHVAGYLDMDVHAVIKDHCYARPWNWKPENVYVKPTRNIFFSSSSNERVNKLRTKLASRDEIIDVEHEDPADEIVLPYNETRIRQGMDESQKLVNLVRPDENIEDDWEETVEKTFWSPIQRRLFTRAYNIFRAERLSRLTNVNCASEIFKRRSSIDTASKRFREVLASTGWDWRIIQWLHTSLIGNLSREYLVIYLDILQTLRAKIPQLIEKMITVVQPNNTGVLQAGSIPLESLNALLKRSWDPISACLKANRPKKLPGNPILIVTSTSVTSNLSPRHHEWISQLGTLGMVVTVNSHLGLSTNRITMMACMDQLVQATRAKIQEVRNDYPGRPMVLIGLNTGAALACQVAQMEHVTAVICLGFPFSTVEGKRGCPDDMLMDIRCPVMFVIGQNSSLVRPEDLEDVRGKMLVETSLVVVGTADDHLRISTAKIVSEGITQSMVDRCILDEIGDFIGGILLQPHPLPLRPTGTFMNFEKTTNKREPRKRKISTSSSIDSESNSPNVNKKTRPCTPNDRWHASAIHSNSISTSKATNTGLTAASESPTLVAFGAGSINNVPNPTQRRNSKVNNNQKPNNSDQLQLARQTIQQNINTSKANGGLTLNIGSLASLAPMGPIRLTPNVSSATTTNANSVKSLVASKSPPPSSPPSSSSSSSSCSSSSSSSSSSSPLSCSSITIPKTSKMIPTSSNSQTLLGKLPSSITATTRSLSKSITTNNHNRNINVQEKTGEAKLVTVFTSGGNQVRVATASNPSTMQTKSISTTAPLTALLHSRKTSVVNNSGRASAPTSTTILLTPPGELSSNVCCGSISIGTSTSTTTMTTTTKVTEENSRHSTITNLTGMKNVVRKIIKNTSTNPVTSTIHELNKSMTGNQATKVLCVNRSTSTENIAKNMSVIGVNNNITTNIDDDLGNILDIPIIFAKDDDNLNDIERTPLPSLLFASKPDVYEQNMGVQHKPFPPSSSSTHATIVLLSNKDAPLNTRPQVTNVANAKIHDKASVQMINTSDVLNHHATLQTCMRNPSTSIGGNRAGGTLQANLHRTVVNSPTMKYTKIILSKRNANTNNNSGNQIILTKNNCKIPSRRLLTENPSGSVSTAKIATEQQNYNLNNDMLNAKMSENGD